MMAAAHGRSHQPQVKPPEPHPPVGPNPPAEVAELPVAKAEKARSIRLDLQAGHFRSWLSSSLWESNSSKTWPHLLQLNSYKGTDLPPVKAGTQWEIHSPAGGDSAGFFSLSFTSSRSPTEQLVGPQPGFKPSLGKTNCTMTKYSTTKMINFSNFGPFGPFRESSMNQAWFQRDSLGNLNRLFICEVY
jgi:hypothetical protein